MHASMHSECQGVVTVVEALQKEHVLYAVHVREESFLTAKRPTVSKAERAELRQHVLLADTGELALERSRPQKVLDHIIIRPLWSEGVLTHERERRDVEALDCAPKARRHSVSELTAERF